MVRQNDLLRVSTSYNYLLQATQLARGDYWEAKLLAWSRFAVKSCPLTTNSGHDSICTKARLLVCFGSRILVSHTPILFKAQSMRRTRAESCERHLCTCMEHKSRYANLFSQLKSMGIKVLVHECHQFQVIGIRLIMRNDDDEEDNS